MENAITKATDYVTFGFSFRILAILSLPGKFQRHFRWFFSVLVAILRKNSNKRPWFHQPERVA